MLLAVDIGNTNISAAIFADNCGKKSSKIIKKFDLPAKTYAKAKLVKNTPFTFPEFNMLLSAFLISSLR